MLNILLMIILIIILFFIILLAVGIRISLKYNKKAANLEGYVKILIFKKIKVFSIEYPSSEKDEKEDIKEEEDEKSRDFKKIFELAKPCYHDLKEFFYSFLNSIDISKLENHMIIGFDSYADTGKYIGIIWGILSVANSFHKNARLSAEPSFNGSVFDSYGQMDINIKVLKLVIPMLKLISKKQVRTMIWGVING